jgi:hypothetical protein
MNSDRSVTHWIGQLKQGDAAVAPQELSSCRFAAVRRC